MLTKKGCVVARVGKSNKDQLEINRDISANGFHT